MAENYVDNKMLYECIVEYKTKCIEAKRKKKEKPPIPEYVGRCVMLIAENLSHKHNFINYTFKDEMICDGIENCISYFDNFDPAKSTNPFAYFTQIIYYAFLRRILKEKKQTYIKHKSLENLMLFDELAVIGEDGQSITTDFDNANVVDFIKSFEDSLNNKKAKNKKKKGVETFFEE